MNTLLASARTFLFVPGTRAERFEKAVRSGADAVVLDLEDSVPLGEKSLAREIIGGAWADLQMQGVPLVVRINALHLQTGRDDLHWLSNLYGLAGVMVPKAESVSVLADVRAMLPGTPILPLIESAVGYLNTSEIAGAEGVLRLVVGHIDFMADTGLQ